MTLNFLFIAIWVVVGATALKQPAWILQYAFPSGLLGILFLLLCFSSYGSVTFGKRAQALSFRKYLGLLSLGQGALCLIMAAIYLAFVGGAQKGEELEGVQFLIKQHYLSHWALFPWGLFGLWALMIAYVSYHKQAYPLIGNVLRLFCTKRFEPALKGFVEYIISASTLLCLALSLAAAIELMSRFIDMQLGFRANHDWMRVVVLGCLYPFFFWSLRSKVFLKFSKKLSLAQLPWIIVVCMVPILVLSAFMAKIYTDPLLNQIVLLRGSCFQSSQISMQSRLLGLLWGGWVLWMPLAGSFIAHLSQGRTLREIVIGVLCFPVLCLLAFHFFFRDTNINLPSMIYIVLSLFILGGLTWTMRGMKNNLFLYAGWMPLPNPPKTSRIDLQWAPKLWGLRKCYTMIVMAVFSILLTYAIGGWVIISFQVLSVAAFMISVLYMVIMGFYKAIFLKRWISMRTSKVG